MPTLFFWGSVLGTTVVVNSDNAECNHGNCSAVLKLSSLFALMKHHKHIAFTCTRLSQCLLSHTVQLVVADLTVGGRLPVDHSR